MNGISDIKLLPPGKHHQSAYLEVHLLWRSDRDSDVFLPNFLGLIPQEKGIIDHKLSTLTPFSWVVKFRTERRQEFEKNIVITEREKGRERERERHTDTDRQEGRQQGFLLELEPGYFGDR